MQVRITNTPPGEAPEDVRRAWVGLMLPLPRGITRPRRFLMAGVLSRPKTPMAVLLAVFRGEVKRELGYPVAADEAVEILGRHAPSAAAWWHQNAPRSIARGKYFLFAANACEIITNEGEAMGNAASELSVSRQFIGKLLSILAGLFIFAGILSPFYATRADWGLTSAMILFGLVLGICAARVAKPPK